MAQPFSTNELLLRSDRIAFGKIPPEVPERTEQTLILPDTTGAYLYFGLSSLVSTSGLTGTLEVIYPQFASFTFDNLNGRLGINNSTPQYAIDISTTTGVRIQGGTLIANASGLVSVPTAALFSTLPTTVFAPGTIPPTAIASTGQVIPGLSVPTSALFSTLPTALFAPSSIPLVALQSSGIIVASSFVGDGYYLSNIPLANINGTITGDFFRPNSIPLSTLASTGQIWIREPTGSIFAPIISTGQFFTSSLRANDISTINLRASKFYASSIQANDFESSEFSASNLSAIRIQASSIQVLQLVSSGRFSGDGKNITNLTPAFLNNVIPSDKFGYRLIAFDALNPYGNFLVEAGTATFKQSVPVNVLGTIYASTFQGGYFRGDGGGLYNINSISTASLVSTVEGLGTVGYVSSTQLASTVRGLATAGYVSSSQLTSTVAGLATHGYISTGQLTSTVAGLGSSDYISSSQLLSTVAGLALFISTFTDDNELVSTVAGLGTSGYISSLSLTSSLVGLGSMTYVSSASLQSTTQFFRTAGFLSSPNLLSTVEGLGSISYVSTTQLASTVEGLGSSKYVSSTQLASTVEGLASSRYVSSSQLASTVEGLATSLYISSTQLISTIEGLGTFAYVSTASLVSTTQGLQEYVSSFIDPTELTSTVVGLGTAGFVSTIGLDAKLASTVQGLGTSLYVSTASLVSTTQGLQEYVSSFIDPTELTSTVVGLGTVGFVSTIGLDAKLASTVQGLGTSLYVSTASLVSTTQGLQEYVSSFIDTTELTSTVVGLGTAGFVSTIGLDAKLASTVQGLGTSLYVSTASLVSTTQGLQEYVSSFIDTTELTSTVVGLGTAGFISTIGLDAKLASTVQGLGSSDYVSTASLVSTTQGLQEFVSSFIDTTELTSTVVGLGTAGFISTIGLDAKLASTVQGLGSSDYVSSLSLVSTTQGIQEYVSSFIDPTELASTITSTVIGIAIESRLTSTVTGLGSSGYVSTLSLYSTVNEAISTFSTAFGPGGVAPFHLASTVVGLGTAGYVSTPSMASSIQEAISSLSTAYGFVGRLTTIPSSLSTFAFFTSSIQASTIQTSVVSSLAIWVSTINGLPPGAGGLATIPSTLSTFAILTSSMTTSTLFATTSYFGTTSTLTALQFYGLQGGYSNTVVAEVSTGAGTQELLLYKVSSVSDRVRVQTTGTFVVETGVSSRLWPVINSNVTPAFIVNANSNVGIQTASPGATLDVAGSGRFQTLSSLTLNTSSILTNTVAAQSITVQSTFTVVGRSVSSPAFVITPSSFIGLNASTPLAQLYIKDLNFPTANPPVSIMDKDPTSVVTSNQTYTGVYVIYTVPAAVASITFNLWGAGGGALGGGGAFVQATVPTTPGEQLRLIIGLAGNTTSSDPTDAQGGAGSNSTSGFDGRGGGRTAVQKFIGGQWVEVVTAGGGGGGTNGFGGVIGGNATWIGQSGGGNSFNGNPGGGGATQTAGGAAGTDGGAGSFQKGGFGRFLGGSGGGGYFGGGGGYTGGGGSSFVLSTLGGNALVTNYSGSNGNFGTPIATTAFGYVSGVGVTGGNGLLAFQYNGFRESDYVDLNRGGTTVFSINSLGGVAVAKAAVTSNYALDVNGNILGTQLTTTTTSTQALFVSTINGVPFTTSFTSTLAGLGTAGYVSSLSLVSTTQGLQAFVSSFIDPNELASSILPFISATFFATSLASTVVGLGTSGYVSSLQNVTSVSTLALFVSSINGQLPGTGSGGLTTLPSTVSTFALLTSSFVASTIQSITISTQAIVTSSITANFMGASTGVVSSFSTNIINFTGGFGYLTMPDIYPNTVYTSTVTASNLLVGWNSVMSPIQFFGFGTYSNSVIAELSTGAANQELVLFRGSNASDRIRMQTTGSIVFEPGVSQRLWPTVPSNVTPAMLINTSSNVGIQIAAPTVPLDVGGAIRAVSLSTLQIAASSLIGNPFVPGAVFTSSVTFRGPSTFLVGAFSTSFMTAGTPEVDFFTNGIQRMTILSNGNVGIGTLGPTVLLEVGGAGRFSSLLVTSGVSTVQLEMSSVVGNNVRGITLSSVAMGASTFTGKWNDAQYYVLQTI